MNLGNDQLLKGTWLGLTRLTIEKGGVCVHVRGQRSCISKNQCKMKITHNQNCPAKSLNSLAPELLENQKSKLNYLVSLFTVVLVVSSMPFPGERQLRRWMDFSRSYLDSEGGFRAEVKTVCL